MRSYTFGFIRPLLACLILSFVLPSHALESAKIVRIIDGDTLKVGYRGKEESVRLIGIDTPESSINPKARKDAERSQADIKTIISLGKEATQFLKTLVKPGDSVFIEFDVQKRDRHGRLLGYVYLVDSRMLNEALVGAGYANVMTVPPNVKYQGRLLRLYREAREQERGLWRTEK